MIFICSYNYIVEIEMVFVIFCYVYSIYRATSKKVVTKICKIFQKSKKLKWSKAWFSLSFSVFLYLRDKLLKKLELNLSSKENYGYFSSGGHSENCQKVSNNKIGDTHILLSLRDIVLPFSFRFWLAKTHRSQKRILRNS